MKVETQLLKMTHEISKIDFINVEVPRFEMTRKQFIHKYI